MFVYNLQQSLEAKNCREYRDVRQTKAQKAVWLLPDGSPAAKQGVCTRSRRRFGEKQVRSSAGRPVCGVCILCRANAAHRQSSFLEHKSMSGMHNSSRAMSAHAIKTLTWKTTRMQPSSLAWLTTSLSIAEKLSAKSCLENSEGATLVTSLELSLSVPTRSLTRSMAILFTKPRVQAQLREPTPAREAKREQRVDF